MRKLRTLGLTAIVIGLLVSCQSKISEESSYEGLTHCVFLKLNDSIAGSERQLVLDALLGLLDIKEVETLSVVERADIGDDRALDYDIMMIATFDNIEALERYDKNASHEEVRNTLKKYLSKPPATFDFIE